MLKTLTVWNFALLERVEINFDDGLNILTGETGAGKSILIDALGAVLGHRLTADAIRTGCDWLRVEAIFDISGEKRLHELLAEQAIDDEDDSLIVTLNPTVEHEAVRWILAEAGRIQVLAPESLRRKIRDAGREIMEKNS